METKSDPNIQRWLNVEQLMAVLPLKRSRVYYLTHARQIPFVRVGKTLLFDYDEIVDCRAFPKG